MSGSHRDLPVALRVVRIIHQTIAISFLSYLRNCHFQFSFYIIKKIKARLIYLIINLMD